MKKILTTISLIAVLVACKDTPSTKITADDMKAIENEKELLQALPKIKFSKKIHDFGTINQGEVVSAEIMINNVGKSDLVISNGESSCGCTVADYPKHPIKPGESAPIKVEYDSSGKSGQQNKTVTLTTNTESGKETFQIKATVKVNK